MPPAIIRDHSTDPRDGPIPSPLRPVSALYARHPLRAAAPHCALTILGLRIPQHSGMNVLLFVSVYAAVVCAQGEGRRAISSFHTYLSGKRAPRGREEGSAGRIPLRTPCTTPVRQNACCTNSTDVALDKGFAASTKKKARKTKQETQHSQFWRQVSSGRRRRGSPPP